MRYVAFICGPWGKPGILGRVLGKVLPQANPDFEHAYQCVTSWWLEIDETGQVQREIAFDVGQCPIAIAPFRQNFGVFTDLEGHPEPLGPELDALLFESAWQEVASRFPQSEAQPCGRPRSLRSLDAAR